MLLWYAIRVKSRLEKSVDASLREKAVETLLPLCRSRRCWSDRVKELELALFPGYVFGRFDIANRMPIVTTPGVIDVVRVGQSFVPIDEREIAGLQAAVAARLTLEAWPYLRAGQRVRIERGPLSGVEGLYVGAKGASRLVLSVSLLQRAVAVEIDSAWASPIDHPAAGGWRADGAALASMPTYA